MANKAQDEKFTTLYKSTFTPLSKHVFFKVKQISDAEDIVQSVYSDFYRYVILKNREPDNVLAYLIQMSDHEIGRYYARRSETADFYEDDEVGIEAIADESDLESELFDKMDGEALWTMVKSLKPQEIQVLVAHFRFDMTFVEIAESLKQNESTVKLRYYRALRKLKQIYMETNEPKRNFE